MNVAEIIFMSHKKITKYSFDQCLFCELNIIRALLLDVDAFFCIDCNNWLKFSFT